MFMPNAPIGVPVPGFSEKDLVRRSASSVPEPWTNPLSREGFLRSRAQLEI